MRLKFAVSRLGTEKWVNLGPEIGTGSEQICNAKMSRIAGNLGMAFWTANGAPTTKDPPNGGPWKGGRGDG